MFFTDIQSFFEVAFNGLDEYAMVMATRVFFGYSVCCLLWFALTGRIGLLSAILLGIYYYIGYTRNLFLNYWFYLLPGMMTYSLRVVQLVLSITFIKFVVSYLVALTFGLVSYFLAAISIGMFYVMTVAVKTYLVLNNSVTDLHEVVVYSGGHLTDALLQWCRFILHTKSLYTDLVVGSNVNWMKMRAYLGGVMILLANVLQPLNDNIITVPRRVESQVSEGGLWFTKLRNIEAFGDTRFNDSRVGLIHDYIGRVYVNSSDEYIGYGVFVDGYFLSTAKVINEHEVTVVSPTAIEKLSLVHECDGISVYYTGIESELVMTTQKEKYVSFVHYESDVSASYTNLLVTDLNYDPFFTKCYYRLGNTHNSTDDHSFRDSLGSPVFSGKSVIGLLAVDDSNKLCVYPVTDSLIAWMVFHPLNSVDDRRSG